MKSKNPWYNNYRGGFQGTFRPRRPPYPTAVDVDTGQKLKPLGPEASMAASQEKLKRQERESNGSSGSGGSGSGGRGRGRGLAAGAGAGALVSISGTFRGLANHGKERLAGVVQNTNRSLSENTKSYIVRFRVGRLPTNSVRQAANLYGTNNIQISNSLSEVVDKEKRKYLSRSFGFNQKSIISFI